MSVRPLTSRVAIVTGANQGIGAATAVALAEAGADVGISFLRLQVPDDDPGRPAAYAETRARDASAVVRAIEAVGRRAVPVEADLSDPSAARRIFDRVEAVLGPVSILVNNASGWRQDTFGGELTDGLGRPNRAVTAASIDAQLLVDARGGALMIAELAIRAQRRNADWGRIVSLTSGGPGGFPGEVSYGAAKAALESFTMSAASELAASGVTANVVYPPVTDTGWVSDSVRQMVAESHDLHHIAEPGDVAEVVVWLCTDAARLVSGSVIRLR